ncbi:hypothetical protein [Sulfuricurvum sp.]|uniref:hypothetical protein n=1 Tax=Sulfuricurvum sp. TaxID=2025608 RepID=UPI002E34083F|nr:hypothetical protein [Sulfuricurvum sp.]HEX5328914.1 hypothetical protein [Sulfuricurvum sp.]
MSKYKMHWLYELHLDTVLEQYKYGLDEEMKKDLFEFSTSKEVITIYYETARKIYYRQPMIWVEWITNYKIKKILKKTSIINVSRILAKQMCERSTRLVFKNCRCIHEIV